jgi:DNA-binding XRE family transcriptional regulator
MSRRLLRSSESTEAEQSRRQHLGDRVAQGRREAGLTQKQLGDWIGATLAQVVKLEDGRADPLPLLPRIAEAIGKQSEWFGVGSSEPGLTPSAELVGHATMDAEIIRLKTELRAAEHQLLERDRRIAELSAELQHLHAERDEARASPLVALSTRRNGPDRDDQEPELEPGGQTPLRPPEPLIDVLQPVGLSRSGRSSLRRSAIVFGAVAGLALAGAAGFLLLGRGQSGRVARAAPIAPPTTIAPEVNSTPRPTSPPAAQTVTVTAPALPPVQAAPSIRPPAETPVLVLNGNGVAGAAAGEALLVKRLRYPVTRVTDAPRQDYAHSVVMYRAGLRTEALRLARKLAVRVVERLHGLRPSALGRAELVVIIGRS